MYLRELNHLSDIEGNHNFFIVFKSSVLAVFTNVCLWRRSNGIYVAVSWHPQLSLCSQHGRTKSEHMLWPMAGLKLRDDMVVVGSTLCLIEVDLIPT